MGTYKFKAKRLNGAKVTGTTEAAGEGSLIQDLRGEGLYVYEIHRIDQQCRAAKTARLHLKEIAFFCNQMGAMLKAGIPLAKALTICEACAGHKQLKAALGEVSGQVQKGQAMSQAMLGLERMFPTFLVFMVEAGEASGTLDRIMVRMARHYEREVELRGKIQTALIYPMILVVVVLFAVTAMVTVVLPQFAALMSDMELPPMTRMLLDVSVFLDRYAILAIIGVGALFCLSFFLFTRKRFRLAVDQWMLMVPVVGKLVKTIYTSRFAASFSILYGNGIGILKCLEICGRVLGNGYVKEKLEAASARLREGEMLSAALKDTGIFQLAFISMVLVGEESGSLEQVLADIGDYYEKEAAMAIAQLVALLEPALILVMGVIVGGIVLAIMLPIFQAYGRML